LLAADSQIVAAAVFSPDNRLLVPYIRAGAKVTIPQPQRG